MVIVGSSRGTYADLVQQKMPTLKAAFFNSASFEAHIREYEAHVDRKGVEANWFFQSLETDLRAMLVARFELKFPAGPDQKKDEDNVTYVTRRDASTTEVIAAVRKAIAPKGVQAATSRVLRECKWEPTANDIGTLRIYCGLHEQRFRRYSMGLDAAQLAESELVKLYLECFAHVKRSPTDADEFSTASILERLGESKDWDAWTQYADHVFAMCTSVDSNDDYLALVGMLPLLRRTPAPYVRIKTEPAVVRIKEERHKGSTPVPTNIRDLAHKLKEARAKYAEKHRDLKCHSCGQTGHISPNCPLQAEPEGRARPDAGRPQPRESPASTSRRPEKVFRQGIRSSPRFAASAMSDDDRKQYTLTQNDSRLEAVPE